MKAIAVYSLCNTMGITLYNIDGDEAEVAWFCGDREDAPQTETIYFADDGRAFISMNGGAYYLDEFMRV